jgi:hypothetical protein
MLNGSVIINGINDKQLRALLTVKIEHEGSLIFNPSQLQPFQHGVPQQRPGQPPPQPVNQEQLYNNAVLTWNSEAGLKAVLQLLVELEGKHHLSSKEAA